MSESVSDAYNSEKEAQWRDYLNSLPREEAWWKFMLIALSYDSIESIERSQELRMAWRNQREWRGIPNFSPTTPIDEDISEPADHELGIIDAENLEIDEDFIGKEKEKPLVKKKTYLGGSKGKSLADRLDEMDDQTQTELNNYLDLRLTPQQKVLYSRGVARRLTRDALLEEPDLFGYQSANQLHEAYRGVVAQIHNFKALIRFRSNKDREDQPSPSGNGHTPVEAVPPSPAITHQEPLSQSSLEQTSSATTQSTDKTEESRSYVEAGKAYTGDLSDLVTIGQTIDPRLFQEFITTKLTREENAFVSSYCLNRIKREDLLEGRASIAGTPSSISEVRYNRIVGILTTFESYARGYSEARIKRLSRKATVSKI